MNRLQTFRLHAAIVYIGFGSILSQILLIREFLVSFYGNELSIGIIFAGWLIWIAIGSAVGNKVIEKMQSISHLFFVLIVLTPIVTIIQILAVKFVRVFLHTTTGEFLSMIELLGFSFAVLSAGCFLWGMLFTLGAKLLSSNKEEVWRGVNKAYVLESLGSVIGGLLFSFILASLFTTFQILFLIVLAAWSVTLWFMISPKKWFTALSLTGLVILFAALLQPLRSLEHQIDQYQWSCINDKLTFIRSMNTKYQNLSLLRLENQHTVYADGRPSYNIPNTYDAEIFTHPIMVHRHHAKNVLLLGGGFNGILKEILKYPVQGIDYVEIDPALLAFIEPVLDTHNLQALHDPRVNTIFTDGREFVHDTRKNYDVILLNIGEPSTANINRFFTVEFYRQCLSRLTPDGILAFSFPSSADYITDELKDLNASIYHTFKQVFQNVLIIPGDHAMMMGSRNKRPFIGDPDSLALLYTTAGISAEYFSKYMFEEKMPPDRIKYITNTLESIQDYRVNTDTHPVTYYFDLLLWNRFLHGDNRFFSSISRTGIFTAGALAVGILLLIVLLRRRQAEKRDRKALALIIACGGMIGMAFNLLLILNFQETFGSIYEMLGAMSAVSMLGLVLGAMFIVRITQKHKMKFVLLVVLITLVSVVLLLPQLLHLLLRVHFMPFTLIITMFGGGLIGMLFGIVNRLSSYHSTDPGSIYAYDVLGSSAGALITCSILLPVLGIQETMLFFACILFPSIMAAALIRRVS